MGQLLHVDGLGEIILDSQLKGPSGIFKIIITAEHDCHEARIQPLPFLYELQSVHMGHSDVCHEKLRPLFPEQRQTFLSVTGCSHQLYAQGCPVNDAAQTL